MNHCAYAPVLTCVGLFTVRAGVLDWGAIEETELQSILDEEDNVKTRIIFAREELKVQYSTCGVECTCLFDGMST